MDVPVGEMEMNPQLPFPEWTPEDIKKMQLARARKMLLEYEIRNDCVPGKKLSKKKTDSSHYNPGRYGRRFRKRVEVRKKRTKSLHQLQDSLNRLHKFLLGFQQDLVTFEQMASEMEQLHRQSLLQKELLDQLQEKKDQDMKKLEKIKKEVKETLELQNAISLEKEQLQAQRNAVLIDKQSREVKAVEEAMVVEVLKEEVAENVELEENQNTWSLTGNLDNREDSKWHLQPWQTCAQSKRKKH